ncbi:hypothetical protein CBR_g51928 [Chara braunii]|uniref:Protein kinase domain-containing protein n=1 Tax=Chara braunii TaxID=69332 RepID=A0A388M996_CHABU|nr:hypothetical protein CBR_g51928 [Chara braunii]|eukprot:GBG91126.1 hypothetical protein CBR_g51928 [Chara braunii]
MKRDRVSLRGHRKKRCPRRQRQRRLRVDGFGLLGGGGGGGDGEEEEEGEHDCGNTDVAAKVLKKDRILEQQMEEKVRREIFLFSRLDHPNIVRLYRVVNQGRYMVLVIEYADNGELFDYIVQAVRLPESEARRIFQQIIAGLEHCHRRGVVHRDLKPENILLSGGANTLKIVKIADLGLGNLVREGAFLKTSCGSPNYAAPEVIGGKPYVGPEVDIWSAGVVLYTLLCGRLPFDEQSTTRLFHKILQGDYVPPSTALSLEARDLIARMLVVDPNLRFTIPEIRRHSWFFPWFIPQQMPAVPGQHQPQGNLGLPMGTMMPGGTGAGGGHNPAAADGPSRRSHPGGYARERFQLPPFPVNNPSLRVDSDPMLLNRVFGEQRFRLGFHVSGSTGSDAMRKVIACLNSLRVLWKRVGPYAMRCLWLRMPPEQPDTPDAPVQHLIMAPSADTAGSNHSHGPINALDLNASASLPVLHHHALNPVPTDRITPSTSARRMSTSSFATSSSSVQNAATRSQHLADGAASRGAAERRGSGSRSSLGGAGGAGAGVPSWNGLYGWDAGASGGAGGGGGGGGGMTGRQGEGGGAMLDRYHLEQGNHYSTMANAQGSHGLIQNNVMRADENHGHQSMYEAPGVVGGGDSAAGGGVVGTTMIIEEERREPQLVGFDLQLYQVPRVAGASALHPGTGLRDYLVDVDLLTQECTFPFLDFCAVLVGELLSVSRAGERLRAGARQAGGSALVGAGIGLGVASSGAVAVPGTASDPTGGSRRSSLAAQPAVSSRGPPRSQHLGVPTSQASSRGQQSHVPSSQVPGRTRRSHHGPAARTRRQVHEVADALPYPPLEQQQ